MTGAETERFLCCLDEDSPFLQAVFASEAGELARGSTERFAAGLWNPQLLWDVALTYAEALQPTPDFGLPPEVKRAHAFLLDPNQSDHVVALAQMLHLPDSFVEGDFLHALLICDDISLTEIGDCLHYDPEVVRLVDQLFFNFRDRRGESLYVAQLFDSLNGRGFPLTEFALKTRSVKMVFAAAGMLPPGEQPSLEMLSEQIEHDLLSLAIAGLDKGLIGGLENPALARVLKHLLPLRQQQKTEEPFQGYHLTQDGLRDLYADLEERLALTRGEIKEPGSRPNQLKNLAQSGNAPAQSHV